MKHSLIWIGALFNLAASINLEAAAVPTFKDIHELTGRTLYLTYDKDSWPGTGNRFTVPRGLHEAKERICFSDSDTDEAGSDDGCALMSWSNRCSLMLKKPVPKLPGARPLVAGAVTLPDAFPALKVTAVEYGRSDLLPNLVSVWIQLDDPNFSEIDCSFFDLIETDSGSTVVTLDDLARILGKVQAE